MHIDQRVVNDSAGGAQPTAAQVGWFAARQPGLVRFLERRLLRGDGDAFAVALEASWRICGVFERNDGVAPRRLAFSLLDRASDGVARQSASRRSVEGCASRQPALCEWVNTLLDDPPLPLNPQETSAVGKALFALVYALDEASFGREVI